MRRSALAAVSLAAIVLAGCAAAVSDRADPAVRSPAAVRARMPIAPPAAPARCADDAGWNGPASPRRVHGDTWYVGTCGITALLIASPAGHVLIDSGTAKAASRVLANLQALGVEPRDVRYIVTSHVHHDHVGGVAALQRASGASVVAMADAATVLRSGRSLPGDPQYGGLSPFPTVDVARTIVDGEVLRLGPLALTAHATPGHAPGGTSWTWRACDEAAAWTSPTWTA